MDVNEMVVFAQVVQAGSFTTAAAKLGMPKSTVSRRLSELEEAVESRLLQRTTRKLSLTDAGRTYYDYCARIAARSKTPIRAVSRLPGDARGLLRGPPPSTSNSSARSSPAFQSANRDPARAPLHSARGGPGRGKLHVAIRAGALAIRR